MASTLVMELTLDSNSPKRGIARLSD
jgi:hypothetical protein